MKAKIYNNFISPIWRYIRYKIIIPIKREKRGPEYIARGTAVGLFCGFTPIVWQMNVVLLIWVIARYFKWNFSLPIGLAWTWVSNTVTNLPLFYLYYLTGNFLLGKNNEGYDHFISFFNNGLWEGIKLLFKDWGVSILLGSFIFMVTSSALGYFITLRYAKARQKNKQDKINAQAESSRNQ